MNNNAVSLGDVVSPLAIIMDIMNTIGLIAYIICAAIIYSYLHVC